LCALRFRHTVSKAIVSSPRVLFCFEKQVPFRGFLPGFLQLLFFVGWAASSQYLIFSKARSSLGSGPLPSPLVPRIPLRELGARFHGPWDNFFSVSGRGGLGLLVEVILEVFALSMVVNSFEGCFSVCGGYGSGRLFSCFMLLVWWLTTCRIGFCGYLSFPSRFSQRGPYFTPWADKHFPPFFHGSLPNAPPFTPPRLAVTKLLWRYLFSGIVFDATGPLFFCSPKLHYSQLRNRAGGPTPSSIRLRFAFFLHPPVFGRDASKVWNC